MEYLEIIYTDSDLFELGIIESYEGDFDSTETMDFEVTLYDPVVPLDGYMFVDGTEFGGKVVNRLIDSKDYTYTYTCRNFRGLLDKKVIVNSRTLTGNITTIINDLLEECDATRLFVCDESLVEESSIVSNYSIPAFSSLYYALMAISASININLLFEYSATDGKCHIIPTAVDDYSDYLNYNKDNTIKFTIEDQRGGANHLICTGVEVEENEKSTRYTIHLFTDENGVVQKFTNVEEATRDSHYILSEKYKVLTGIDEVVEVLDVETLTMEYDYELVKRSTPPSDWKKNYKNYYTREIDSETGEERVDEYGNYSYEQAVPAVEYEYTLATKYVEDATYYEYNSADPEGYSEANIVSEETTYKEVKLKHAPKDWAKHYDQYYIRKSDGTGYVYETVSSASYDDYDLLTKEPSDWESNCTAYFKRNSDYGKTKEKLKKDVKKQYKKNWKNHWKERYANLKKKYIPVTKIVIHEDASKLWKKITGNKPLKKIKKKVEIAPDWARNKYYKKVTRSKAPNFSELKPLFLPKDTVTHVNWHANTYYTRAEKELAPQWKNNTYYYRYPDHYYNMVREGLAYLLENRNQQIKKVSLDELEVSIGDIVGGTEETTGTVIDTDNDVRNIVVKLKNGVKTDIEYTIGGSDQNEIEKGKYDLWNGSTYWDDDEEET